MTKIGMVSPWVEEYRRIEALFSEDPEVKVIFDEDECKVKIYVESERKAEALTKILPTSKTYGNVTLTIDIIPANTENESLISIYKKAFEGNGAVSFIETVDGPITNTINFVCFKNKVVQYFNDDLGDPHGLCSTLYQDIAKNLFEVKEGIFFCTDRPE